MYFLLGFNIFLFFLNLIIWATKEKPIKDGMNAFARGLELCIIIFIFLIINNHSK